MFVGHYALSATDPGTPLNPDTRIRIHNNWKYRPMSNLRAPGQRPDCAGVRGERVRTDPVILVLPEHRLNMELGLQRLFGLHVHSCTHWLRPRNPPPPRISAPIRGRYWSTKIDDISLWPPVPCKIWDALGWRRIPHHLPNTLSNNKLPLQILKRIRINQLLITTVLGFCRATHTRFFEVSSTTRKTSAVRLTFAYRIFTAPIVQ